jgi:hypothetical protein
MVKYMHGLPAGFATELVAQSKYCALGTQLPMNLKAEASKPPPLHTTGQMAGDATC